MTAFIIRMVNKSLPGDQTLLTDLIRPMLHLGLFSAWGFSLYRRVVQKQARLYFCGIAVLMVLWLNIKALKYYIVTDIGAARYLWYLYYLPLVYIPLFILFTALFIGNPEDYRLPRRIHVLHIPALLLFIMVMCFAFA